jgi:hypothetical protein
MITPKIKAEKMVAKNLKYMEEYMYNTAVQMARHTVEEILNIAEEEFWQDVLVELNKL